MFGRFARAVARRYARRGVHHWEIWNEPNIVSAWHPRPSPAKYARLLRSAYRGIHGADRRAVVVTGGLSPATTGGGNIAPVRFLRRVYAAGGGRFFDAVGHHPSTFPALPSVRARWSAWRQMFGTRPSLRSVLRSHGHGWKKIWVTEYSAPTGGDRAVSEARQAEILTVAYRLAAGYRWMGPVFWFSYRDQGGSGSWIDYCGLVRGDYSPKPALLVYQAIAAGRI